VYRTSLATNLPDLKTMIKEDFSGVTPDMLG
jgi:hypothetical protein